MPPWTDTIERFDDHAVRDLAWLLFAPDLLDAHSAGAPLARPLASAEEAHATLRWLDTLDADPDALHALVCKPNLTRLGFYAEALLEYFLRQGPAARLIAANVPLRRDGITMGEVDFLLETARGERLHWELAVKFYLHVDHDDAASPARLADYVGPGLQDRFDLKHERLIHHQLAMSARPEFASLGFDGPWLGQLFVKGRLFYRYGREGDQAAAGAPGLAAQHERGWWMTVSEWREAHADRPWLVLPRLGWLAPLRAAAIDVEQARLSMERIDATRSPIMAAMLEPGARGGLRERSRGFIVPDEWPEAARAYAHRELGGGSAR